MPQQDYDVRDVVVGCGIIAYFVQELIQFFSILFVLAFSVLFIWHWKGWYKLLTLRNPGERGAEAKLWATFLMLFTLGLIAILALFIVSKISAQ